MKRIKVGLEAETIREIDGLRREQGYPSRAAFLRELVEIGLKVLEEH